MNSKSTQKKEVPEQRSAKRRTEVSVRGSESDSGNMDLATRFAETETKIDLIGRRSTGWVRIGVTAIQGEEL